MIGVATALLLLLVGLGIPVAAALFFLGVILGDLYAFLPPLPALGDIAWSTSTEFLLISVPLFILMGEVLLRAGLADDMYRALAPLLARIPGGLMHTNIASCALFAATSGSSVATAATVGTVAMPNMERYGYGRGLFLGSIAAGGTLGILIPPSINFILYGLLTNSSVPRLYLAGMIPGVILASLFMLYVLASCLLRPTKGGTPIETTWGKRISALKDLVAPVFVFVVVVGSIYAGWATPTEAASLGVIAALAIAAWERRLSFAMLRAVLEGTMRTTAMIMLIIIAAQFLNFVLASIGFTDGMGKAIEALGLGPIGTLLLIIVFYLVLGCFMETISMMILTTPFIFPIVTGLGWDPIWWGIVLTILIEAALITPPVGLNLYVVQGMRERGAITDVIWGALPFVALMMTLIGLLMAFPGIALWLPKQVMG